MAWKDSYLIGVSLIDEQHKELFERVFDFVGVVRSPALWNDKQKKVEQTLAFMKDYVVIHFKAEENYQEKIGYPFLEEHKKIHSDMVDYVLQVEKEHLKSGASESLMQRFAGRLMSWLINHVASEDRKIGDFSKGKLEASKKMTGSFYEATREVFDLMLNVEASPIKNIDVSAKECITVRIDIYGDREGSVIYQFPKETILNMVKMMSGMEVSEIDEFVTSAAGEIANIISGKALISMSEQDISCDISPPQFSCDANETFVDENTKIYVSTEVGKLTIAVNLIEI